MNFLLSVKFIGWTLTNVVSHSLRIVKRQDRTDLLESAEESSMWACPVVNKVGNQLSLFAYD